MWESGVREHGKIGVREKAESERKWNKRKVMGGCRVRKEVE